jgi:hypothetical protein
VVGWCRNLELCMTNPISALSITILLDELRLVSH